MSWGGYMRPNVPEVNIGDPTSDIKKNRLAVALDAEFHVVERL